MKKLISLIIVCFVYSSLHAQALRVRVDSLSVSIGRSNAKIENLNIDMEDIEESVDGLARQVENLSYLVETQKEIISQEQSAIENSMGAVNIFLAVFALILTIGGIYLGWFINRREKNVQSLLKQVETKKEEVEKLEEKTSNTRKEVMELSDNINKDIEGLYAKLRREETITHLKRLVYEPNDICNILPLLLSRELIESDFKYLLTAYRNLENKDDNGVVHGGLFARSLSSKGKYLLLFYQHFCGQALCHELVAAEIVSFFPYLLQCAFKNDVISSTTSMVNYFNRGNVAVNKVETIYLYLKALHESKHSNLEDAYSIIVSKYRNDDELKDIWRHLEENHVYIKLFNKLICEAYQEDETFVARVKAQKEESIEENKTGYDEPKSK